MKSFKSVIEKKQADVKTPNGFCILKPGFVDEYEEEFCSLLEHYGWNILDKKRVRLSPDQASLLYVNLEEEPYYKELCNYMSSGDCLCCSCRNECADPIKEMADLKKCVREMWGEDEMKNAMHSSDSADNVVRECGICLESCDNNIKEDNSNSYDDIITRLTEAKENAVPVEEGIFKALVGGVAGMTIAPSIMKALCSILGVDVKGQFGSVLTSRLVLTALCAKMGWDR